MQNSREDEDSGFLEAEEQEQSSDHDQHQQRRNSNEEGTGFERVVKNGVEVGETSCADIPPLQSIRVAVLEHAQMAVSFALISVSDPLGLNERHEVQDTPNDGKQTPQNGHSPVFAHVAKVVSFRRIGVEFRIHDD